MLQNSFASAFFCLSTLYQGSSALPSPSTGAVADRYVPGRVGALIESMKLENEGALSVGADGVLRSFAANGTVVDYRQLDPNQMASFANRQLAVWQGQDRDIPDSVVALANAPAIDGRLVTDLEELLNPTVRPNLTAKGDANAQSPAVKQREALDDLKNLEKRQCTQNTCFALTDCLVIGCYACFYPAGPPLGICFVD